MLGFTIPAMEQSHSEQALGAPRESLDETPPVMGTLFQRQETIHPGYSRPLTLSSLYLLGFNVVKDPLYPNPAGTNCDLNI